MAPVLELDRQTTSFVRQLEEQRKLEKSLLVERVRGTKEGLESVFGDIKSRVEMLEKLNGSASASCIAPMGWSKLIFTGADSVSSPNTIGFAIGMKRCASSTKSNTSKTRTISVLLLIPTM